jgi:hypothetical protein
MAIGNPAVILFRANRVYMRQSVEHLPGAWERYILFRWYFAQEAQQLAVGAIFRMQAIHALQHIDEGNVCSLPSLSLPKAVQVTCGNHSWRDILSL